MGAQLLHRFHWITYVFGAILVFTAIKFLRDTDEKIDPQKTRSIRWLMMVIPVVDRFEGPRFFFETT